MFRVPGLFVLCLVALVACDDDPDSTPLNDTVGVDTSAGSDGDITRPPEDTHVTEPPTWPLETAGMHVLNVSFDGLDREVHLAVPDAGASSGVVLLLHGSGQTAESFLAKRRAFVALAHQQSWLVVAPLAEALDGKTRWNFAGDAEGPRDDAFILSLLDQLSAQGVSGPTFLASFSNGGRMTHALLGQHPERFNAGGIVASNLGTYDVLGTDEDRVVPATTGPANVWMANGSQDPSVPFEGGTTESGTAPSVQDAIDRWTAANGCSGEGARREFAEGYELTWTDCAERHDVVQVAYRSSVHAWPEEGDVSGWDANEELMAFFLLHR